LPSLNFVMPHWLYWAGLFLFPIFAMAMVRRARTTTPRSNISTPLAYLFLLTGGFVGIHRFYLRNWLGVLYLPLFAGIIYSNVKFRATRDVLSKVRRDMQNAAFEAEHWAKQAEAGVQSAAPRLETAKQTLASAQAQLADSTAAVATWDNAAMALAAAIALFMLFDAFVLHRLAKSRAEREPWRPDPGAPVRRAGAEDPNAGATAFTRAVDAVSGWTGHYVAYWSVLAVFVYYYEVLARYVFNSPTNWAHESMFLMFGMQYLLSGAFALREDSHVRVDVVYVMLSPRGRRIMDVVTSVFFFIFSGTLLWTGYIFARDSIGVWEVSFTEWAIQYWPVKATIAIGAALILLQGAAKLVKDVNVLRAGEA
jgi:TRAP-type mannitol/chloroaromatic compound transport system permease small subunit